MGWCGERLIIQIFTRSFNYSLLEQKHDIQVNDPCIFEGQGYHLQEP